eukprot:353023-Chlamydomonas_euryale.AAC.1
MHACSNAHVGVASVPAYLSMPPPPPTAPLRYEKIPDDISPAPCCAGVLAGAASALTLSPLIPVQSHWQASTLPGAPTISPRRPATTPPAPTAARRRPQRGPPALQRIRRARRAWRRRRTPVSSCAGGTSVPRGENPLGAV